MESVKKDEQEERTWRMNRSSARSRSAMAARWRAVLSGREQRASKKVFEQASYITTPVAAEAEIKGGEHRPVASRLVPSSLYT